jgi:hypothetical protein
MRLSITPASTKHGLCQVVLLRQNFFLLVLVAVAVSALTPHIKVAMVEVAVTRVEFAPLLLVRSTR